MNKIVKNAWRINRHRKFIYDKHFYSQKDINNRVILFEKKKEKKQKKKIIIALIAPRHRDIGTLIHIWFMYVLVQDKKSYIIKIIFFLKDAFLNFSSSIHWHSKYFCICSLPIQSIRYRFHYYFWLGNKSFISHAYELRYASIMREIHIYHFIGHMRQLTNAE